MERAAKETREQGMTELRHLGMVADESDLVAILRARLEELNVSQAELDATLKLPGGYTGKRLAVPPLKHYGKDAWWNTCERLGIAVLLVVDPAATKRYANRMKRRDKQYVRKDGHWGTARVREVMQEITRKNASKGGYARAAALSAERATCLARRAVNARWKRHRKAKRESKTNDASAAS
jgi:hypothetical protein